MASSVASSSVGEIPLYQVVLQDPLVDEAVQKIQSIPKEERFRWPDAKLYRETIEFGIVYRQLEENQIVEKPMPDYIAKIRRILYEKFRDKIQEGSRPEEFNNCIVSLYAPGDGMVPHTDRSTTVAKDGRERMYYFGDSILGLILVPDTKHSIYFINPEDNERIILKEEKGTAFLFQGELRQKWKHALEPIETSRISVTFRKVNFKPGFHSQSLIT
jgi:hypothetical protein